MPTGPRETPSSAVTLLGSAADLVAAVHAGRPMLAAMLEQAASVTLADGRLEIRFPAGLEPLCRQLGSKDIVKFLGGEATRITGRPVEVEVAGAGDDAPALPARTRAPAQPRAAAPTPGRAEPPAPGADPTGLLEQARREPGVRRLMDAFGAHVVDIRRLDAGERSKPRGRPARAPEDAP